MDQDVQRSEQTRPNKQGASLKKRPQELHINKYLSVKCLVCVISQGLFGRVKTGGRDDGRGGVDFFYPCTYKSKSMRKQHLTTRGEVGNYF